MTSGQADRDLVPGRSADRPERHLDPLVGSHRLAATRTARHSLRMGLSLRRRLPQTGRRRRTGHALCRQRSHEPAPAGHQPSHLTRGPWPARDRRVPDGTPAASCSRRTISRSSACQSTHPSSTRSKTSGSICARTSSPCASTTATRTSSMPAAKPGTISSQTHRVSCPSPPEPGATCHEFSRLVLHVTAHAVVNSV